VANGSCETYDSVEIINDTVPSTSLAGPDRILCNQTTVTMAGNTPAIGTGTWILVSGPNTPTFVNPNSPTTVINGLTTGTYVFRWSIGTFYQGCPNSTDDVTVFNYPDITILGPSDFTICTGGSQNLSVTVFGGTGVYSYQWQQAKCDCCGDWSNVGGANSITYNTGALIATSYYRCVVSQTPADCGSTNSGSATVTVVPDPTITVDPVGTTICNGGTHTMNVTVSGGFGSYTYQWQSATSCAGPFTNVGTNSSSYTTPALSSTTSYRVFVTQSGTGCTAMTSACVDVIVVPDPIITGPSDITICSGTSTTLTVTASGGTGPFTYQWQEASSCGGSFSNIPGANLANYTTPILT